ncbi:BppU family phage baseplate upper protein [Bacillus infantis]|uniref:BppU family phage baseplate upper protein n=1 Tax=Bacillus infantis TaxID=324767 RepID=UPI0039828B7C
METQKKTSLSIDLKQTTMIPMPQFIQQDTNVLEFEIKENGEAADLSNIGRIVVNYKRPDGKVISRLLSVEENTVSYSIGVEEMQVAGYAEIELQFYSKNNLQRISTKRFKVSMSQEIGTREIGDTEGTLTILQELFVEVESLVADTEAAAQHANDEAEYARAKGNYADEKAKLAATEVSNLETLKADVVDATNAANTAAQYATETALGAAVEAVNVAENAGAEAKQTADTAAANADEKAALAQTQADYAKEQGDIAKQKQAELEGLSVVQYNDRLVKVENELSDSNRQSQNLQHGVQVINASADSLADFEIAGRTLIPMASTPLRGGMFYVLADKRTIIAIDGQRKQGVTKFQKGTTPTTTTANFAGKVPKSTEANPHIAYAMQAGHALMTPTTLGYELSTYNDAYGKMSSLNGISNDEPMQETGSIPQHVYAFNVIEQIERNMGGRIPGTTTAAKVQWLKDNIETMNFNWHGYGKGPSGSNKVTVSVWDNNSSQWLVNATHTLNRVSLLTITSTGAGNRVDANGKAHFLAYADPATDAYMSYLYTDYVELVITLKAGAQLDTRPQIIRIANFQDKVSGSTVENPHDASVKGFSALYPPTGQWDVPSQYNIDKVMKADGIAIVTSQSVNGNMSQTKFSFNLIEEYERNVGKIPGSTLAQKRQWLIDNLASLKCNWHGFGSSVGGNKASFRTWNAGNAQWDSFTQSHTNSSVAQLRFSWLSASVPAITDSNGFVHFLAYAEPSDGTTASTINTDYVELEIELKPGANIYHPVVPLYEVTQAEYDNILVAWNELDVMNRYPKVQGMQHLQNPAVVAEGENLVDIFQELSAIAPSQVQRVSENEVKVLGPLASFHSRTIGGPFVKNAQYTLTYDYFHHGTSGSTIFFVIEYEDGTSSIGYTSVIGKWTTMKLVSLAGKTVKSIRINYGVNSEASLRNFMLTLGAVEKPFVPRNPSYLFAQVKLGQIGDKKDILFRQDGNWMLRKEIEKDVVLEGSLDWGSIAKYTSFKRVRLALNNFTNYSGRITKYNGQVIKTTTSLSEVNSGSDNSLLESASGFSFLHLTVSDNDTGFTDAYTPTNDDWKRYFNGWKYQDGTTWISVTGNGQTATAATGLTTKPTDYVPYKLSYVLATPQMVNVTDKVEGDIAVNGPTQVEVTSGVVVREKVVPNASGTNLYLNDISQNVPASHFKFRADKLMGLYKNGQLINRSNYTTPFIAGRSNGNFLIYADKTQRDSFYDPTAEYTVTYLVLDRHLFTVNATEVKAFFDKSMKSVVDKLVEREADNTTLISIINKQMYDILVRLKAGGI